MILVDTSVWIDHFRSQNPALIELLEEGQVGTHPFIIGELACGNLKQRDHILELLSALPTTEEVEHDEVLEFVAVRKLHGQGIGWIDVHLLASAILSGVPLWTNDKKLRTISAAVGVLY